MILAPRSLQFREALMAEGLQSSLIFINVFGYYESYINHYSYL